MVQMTTLAKAMLYAVITAVAVSISVTLVWRYLTPVVVLMSPIEPLVQTSNNSIMGEFTGFKLKGCPPVSGSERGFMKLHGVWYEDVPFEFLGDISPGSSKPRWKFSYFGWWRWEPNSVPTEVMMQLDHICGDHKQTTTIGPFPVMQLSEIEG